MRGVSFEQVEKDEKGKFSIVRQGQVPIKLRADSVQESDDWISRMSSAVQQVILDYFQLLAVIY